jgi:predicted O-methyltransferase YrrM
MKISPKYIEFLAAGMIAVVANVALQSPAFKDYMADRSEQIEKVQMQKEEARKNQELETSASNMPKTMSHDQAVERVKEVQAKMADREGQQNNVTRVAPR